VECQSVFAVSVHHQLFDAWEPVYLNAERGSHPNLYDIAGHRCEQIRIINTSRGMRAGKNLNRFDALHTT
jgi:hypothetical protein